MFHQHHVVKTFAKDQIPDPAGTPDVTFSKRDCLPMPPTGTNPTANQQSNFESIQWSVSPNTVIALPLSSITTPVTEPPRQSHSSRSPSVIHFGDFPTDQRSSTATPTAISNPRFSLPLRRFKPITSDQTTQTQSEHFTYSNSNSKRQSYPTRSLLYRRSTPSKTWHLLT